MNSELLAWRKDTPGCLHRIHLNNAGAALMPVPVRDAIKHHIDLEAEMGGYEAADHRHDEIEQFYSTAATMFGGRPENFAFVNNATDAYSRALSAIPFRKGDVILTTDNDYISNHIAFISLTRRFGVDVRRIRYDQHGKIDLEDARDNIVRLQPVLVAVSQVATNSGIVQPVKELGALCGDADCLYLVDACQSVGQLNVNVHELGCDFLSATFRKFMRGPRGAGVLYVSSKALDMGMEPLFIDMRGARWQDQSSYRTIPSAKRFEDWEFSYALVLGSCESLKYADTIGIEKIWNRVKVLADRIRLEIAGIDGADIPEEGDDLCGIVPIHFGKMEKQALTSFLSEKKVNFSISTQDNAVIYFGEKKMDWTLRISPHYYNSEEEIDSCADMLKGFLKSYTN